MVLHPQPETMYRFNSIYDDIRDINLYLTQQKAKLIESKIKIRARELQNCMLYLSTLEAVLGDVNQYPSYFGLEVLVNELETLFRPSINTSKSDDYEQTNDDSFIYELLISCNRCSYIYIQTAGKCEPTVIFKRSIPQVGLQMSVLEDYMRVGNELKENSDIIMLMEEIEKLHTDEPGDLSPHMTIVGPSFLGKTQTAFTLLQNISVYYFNFLTVLPNRSQTRNQRIYSIFSNLTKIMSDCIKLDISHDEYCAPQDDAGDISVLNYPMKTLGFLYVLMFMRERFDSAYDWLLALIQMEGITFPSLTIEAFKKKTEDFDYKKQLIFIDELPNSSDLNIADTTEISLLLEGHHNAKYDKDVNIGRALKLPVVISGTNSKINNLSGTSSFSSRVDPNYPKPWVQVVVKTAKASIKSLSEVVQFESNDGLLKKLSEFVVSRETETIDYNRLFTSICGPDIDTTTLGPIKKLMQFILAQSSTALPGIIALVLSELFTLLPRYITDFKGLWRILNENLVVNVVERKRTLDGQFGLFSSIHILSFKSPLSIYTIEEDSRLSAHLVEKHLYHYGAHHERTFRLNLKYDRKSKQNILCRINDDSEYKNRCHFLEIHEDFFTSLTCLNTWNDPDTTSGITIAGAYEDHLKNKQGFSSGALKIIQDSLKFEILAHWSICAASHHNLNGEAIGTDVFVEFVKQLQPHARSNLTVNFHLTELINMPSCLHGILSKVKVPYLLRFPEVGSVEVKNNFKAFLGDFAKFGESRIPPDQLGLDVIFDIEYDGVPCLGFIECKLWESKAIGINQFYNYYRKACTGKYPISFLACCSIQVSLKQLISDIGSIKPKASVKKLKTNATKAVAVSAKEDPEAILKGLWESSENHINIYAVHYSETESRLYKEIDGKFTVKPLKLFAEPKGAFVLVESKFSPPHISN